jgi:hypothetical protein
MLFPADTPDYLSVLGTNYDVYVIENERKHQSGLSTLGVVSAPISTIIAVTNGATSAFEAILAPLIQSAPTETLDAQVS